MSTDVGDLALLSDCQTAALVTRDGSVDWWPGPRFDGPSVFARLLDPDAGHLSVRPATQTTAAARRSYVDGTLVLRTEHRVGTATLTVSDCLALDPAAEGHEIGLDVPHALVRVLEARGGDVDVAIEYVPRTEYGLVVPRLTRQRGAIVTVGGPERLTLTGADELELGDSSARGVLRLRAGERRGIVLRRGDDTTALDPLATIDATVGAWRSWSVLHEGHDGPYAEAVDRAALVLQGLTYQPSGAIVAAPTTSLPEVRGGPANWDYRYAWLRDASLVARALLDATCSDEAERYFQWMTRAAVSCRASSHVQVVFGVAGERNLEERALDHLRGYADSRPVRIGNAAWRQKQLDVLGEILDVACALGDDLALDEFTASFLCQLADRAAQGWQEPDTGMWEARAPMSHHTMSKVMCWVALDRAARLGDRLGPDAQPQRWRREADRVRSTVLRHAWSDERGAFAGTCGGDRLDAAVLLAPSVGFVAADDPRMLRTASALQEALDDGGLLRRHEDLDDEGAFLPATFWLAAWHAQAGDPDRARDALERAMGCANDLGLLAEMALPSGVPLGNTPQALSHVGLVAAATRVAEAERAVAGRAAR